MWCLLSCWYHCSPFLGGIHSKTPSWCLKLRIMSNRGHATFSPVHISLHGSLWQIRIASTAALALWALLSEIRAAWTQALILRQTTKVATKWLTGSLVHTVWRRWTQGSVTSQAGWSRIHHTKNDLEFKTYELLISGIFYLILLDHR